jgi:hypothetical protein
MQMRDFRLSIYPIDYDGPFDSPIYCGNPKSVTFAVIAASKGQAIYPDGPVVGGPLGIRVSGSSCERDPKTATSLP